MLIVIIHNGESYQATWTPTDPIVLFAIDTWKRLPDSKLPAHTQKKKERQTPNYLMKANSLKDTLLLKDWVKQQVKKKEVNKISSVNGLCCKLKLCIYISIRDSL